MADVHFITVEWCNSGFRGIFSRSDGQAAAKEDVWTRDEMDDFLGSFTLILSPESEVLTQSRLKQYSYWFPLAEYCHEWGIALTEADGLAWCETVRNIAEEKID